MHVGIINHKQTGITDFLIKLLKELKNLSYTPDTTSTRHKFSKYRKLTSKKNPPKPPEIPIFFSVPDTDSPRLALEEWFFTRKIKSFRLPLID